MSRFHLYRRAAQSYVTSFFVKNPAPRYPQPGMECCLIGRRILLRLGQPEDWRSWHIVREKSRAFLAPWEPSWPSHALSYDYFCGQLHRHYREWREGKGYAFQICALSEQGWDESCDPLALPVIGGLALSDVVRGIAQKGTVGYWIGEPFAGQGYMSEALDLICAFAFNDLALHRVEAACLPHNEPSRRLLKKNGFREEGLAKDYLRINGQWEDHILWGKIKPVF